MKHASASAFWTTLSEPVQHPPPCLPVGREGRRQREEMGLLFVQESSRPRAASRKGRAREARKPGHEEAYP